jgi:proteic killer suppression protein
LGLIYLLNGNVVHVLFNTSKLEKELNGQELLLRRHGPRRAGLIRRRLNELHAAMALEDLRRLPGPRCHELTGDRKGQLSVDLDQPCRLLFEVADDPVPVKPDGGLDWTKVTTIRIPGVEDTHE